MNVAQTNKRVLVIDADVGHRDESFADFNWHWASGQPEAVAKLRKATDEHVPFALVFVSNPETLVWMWEIDSSVQGIICADETFDFTKAERLFGKSEKWVVLKKPFSKGEVAHFANLFARKWLLESQSDIAMNFEQLAHSQKMEAIGRLASGIAHDFNNLLTINLGYASLLLGQNDLSKKARSCVEAMNDATERAAGLTRQLLAFSRQQASRETLSSANDLIKGLHPLLARATGEGITIELDLSDEVHAIKVDKTQVEQILLNLVINARDAMDGAGTIFISTKAQKTDGREEILISVRDTGHGMTEQVKDRIFEPFFTTKEAHRGTGLGLSTVFGIVQKHQGRIWVDSQIDVGSSFHIAFPAHNEPLPIKIESIKNDGTQTKYVLVVDDENEVREVVIEMLKEAGFSVFAANGSEEAMKHFSNPDVKIDLMLTDVVMPKVTGIKLAENVTKEHPEVPVVFMSGHPRDPQFQHEVEIGEKRFLQKPFSGDALIKAVQEAFSGDALSNRTNWAAKTKAPTAV